MISQKQQGFTLIEIMVVIVILGVLVSIALPNFVAATERAKHARVKSNMQTTQIMVETYGVDWGAVYPATRNELVNSAQNEGYWKTFDNPFSGQQELISDTTMISGLDDLKAGMIFYFGSGTPGIEGVVTPPPTEYVIYGLILETDGEIDLVKRRGREPFYLHNH